MMISRTIHKYDCGNPLVPDPLEKWFERGSKHLPAFDELNARMDEERKIGIPLHTMV